MGEQELEFPEPDVYRRYLEGETLDAEDHMVLQTYLTFRCLQEAQHICDNTRMQMAALGEVLEKVGGD